MDVKVYGKPYKTPAFSCGHCKDILFDATTNLHIGVKKTTFLCDKCYKDSTIKAKFD